jgi:outer membrane protein
MAFQVKWSHQVLMLAGMVALSTTPALALEQGDWLVRIGGSYVSPDDSSGMVTGIGAGSGVSVDSAASLSFTIGKMITPNMAVEVLGAWPFKHDISGSGTIASLGEIAETKHLPPVVSLQYHFMPTASVRPYVGLGVNYTYFFDEETTGAIAGTPIDIDDSFGPAAQIGVDVDLNKDWFVSADVRYIGIETTATLGNGLGTVDVDINPLVYTVAVGTRF